MPEQLSIDENEAIYISMPSYFEKLGTLLQNTTKRVIANYMMYRVVNALAPYLTKRIHKPRIELLASINGYERNPEPRWRQCISEISSR